MPLVNHCYGNYYSGESAFAAGIQVTYDVGARCTCSDGSTTLTAPNTSGKPSKVKVCFLLCPMSVPQSQFDEPSTVTLYMNAVFLSFIVIFLVRQLILAISLYVQQSHDSFHHTLY